MSFADDAEFAAFVGRDHLLPAVTTAAVTSALSGFALPLLPGKDMDWLAMAVRRALAISIPNISDGPERTSNKDIRDELERLAALASGTWAELFERDPAADSQLWEHAWRRWDGEGGADVGDGMVIGEPTEYRRATEAISELEWLASYLRDAANGTAVPRGAWRQSEERRLREQRGQWLAPIYEAAFGPPVSANNFGTDAVVKAPTPFMDFYSRMITLAFGARETVNLSEVVKQSCRLHKQWPVKFADSIIPGL